MRRAIKGTMMALLLVFGAVSASAQVDMGMLPADLQDEVQDLLATRFPPELHSVTLNPENPVGGEPTAIEVEIYNDAELTDDETVEVYVLYSTDFGGSWDYIELDTDDDKLWYGELPAFNGGDEVIYAVRAVDTSSNVFTQVPCVTFDEDVLDGKTYSKDYVMNDCVNGTDKEDCGDFIPRLCMMQLGLDEEPIDDEEDQVPNEFDILDHRFGFNADYFYFDVVTEGTITQGTMNPVDLHLFAAVLGNYDLVGKETDLTALMDAGGVLVYAPLAEMAGGEFLPCLWGYSQGGDFAQDGDSVECIQKKNHLMWKMERAAFDKIGDNPSGWLFFLTLNGAITNFPDPIEGKPYNYSRATTIAPTEATYFEVQ